MKKVHFKPFLVLLLYCFLGSAHAQERESDKFYFAVLSAGMTLNNPINYYFVRESEYTLINPGVYSGIGLGYGPFEIVEITQFFIGITASYTKVSTPEIQLLHSTSTKAKLIIETFPVLIWGKLQVNTKLSPFVEIGIGYSRLNFIERYSSGYRGASFNYWALGYESGAGLSYRYSKDINLEFVVHNITNEKEKIVENDRDRKAGIGLRNVALVYGLRLNIKL